VVGAEDFFLSGGDGNQYDVILILSGRRLALASQHAVDGEGNAADANDLADGVGASEQVIDHRLSEQGDLGSAIHVLVGEGLAGGDGEVADLEVIRRDALDGGGPVVVAEDDLRTAANGGRGGLHGGALGGNGAGVVFSQGDGHAAAQPDARTGDGSREHDEQVTADGLDLLLDAGGGAGADGHHGDNRGHADDDAEHGKRGAEAIDTQGAEGDFDGGNEFHGASPRSADRAGLRRAGRRRTAVRKRVPR
jgi:hypothetical protein